MKIAFVTSSAEPGKDGMGDYTLSLAAALSGLGHSVLVIGLNDRWIEGSSATEAGLNADNVAVQRLASSLPFPERVDRACARMIEFRPDWVSFQMSCYAYHRKGILLGVNRHLRRLAETCENWQVMFQELWIGGTSWKSRLVAALQRHSIAKAVRILRPRVCQTSTPVFRALLKTIGIEASVLPLAGSIPVNPEPGTDWFLQVLGHDKIPVAAEKRREYLVGGFFGALYPGWEPEPFFSALRRVVEKTGQKVVILAAGRMGGGREAMWNKLAPAYPDFHFHEVGELPVSLVSQYLRNLDFGIAATPWLGIGKSSATAAMLDHGLPVMVTRNDSRPPAGVEVDPPGDALLILADRDVSARFFEGLPRREPRHSAKDLALNFARQLESHQLARECYKRR